MLLPVLRSPITVDDQVGRISGFTVNWEKQDGQAEGSKPVKRDSEFTLANDPTSPDKGRVPSSRPPPMLLLDLENEHPSPHETECHERLTPCHARKGPHDEDEAQTQFSYSEIDLDKTGTYDGDSSSMNLVRSTTMNVRKLLEDQLNQLNSKYFTGAASRNNVEVDIILNGELPRWCFLRETSRRARFIAAWLKYATMWAVFMAPLACALALDGERRDLTSPAYRQVDIAITLIHALGALIIRLRTTVLDDSREAEVAAPRSVCKMVLTSPTYWLDFFSMATLLPLLVPQIRSSKTACRWLPGAALLRAWRLWKPGNENEMEIQDRWFQYRNVCKLVARTALIAHFFACLWFLVLDLSGTLREHSWAETDGDDLVSLYSHSLVTGAGLLYGYSNPIPHSDLERFLLALAFPIAATVMAVLFAELVMTATRISIISHRRHEQMAYVQSATQQLGVEPGLRRKILKYHSFLQWHHDTEMYRLLFSSISEKLLHELKWQLFRHFIREAPLLHNLGMERILELILAFQEFVFCPGDVVVRQGDQGFEMYFIVKGICDVVDEHSRPLAVKHKGDYFGEICLFFPEICRTATVRARTFCVIARLTRDHFDNIIHEGSEERRRMLKRIAGFHNVNLPPTPSPDKSPLRKRSNGHGKPEGLNGKATPDEHRSPGLAMSPDSKTPVFVAAAGGSHNGSRDGSNFTISNTSSKPRSGDTLLSSLPPPLDLSVGVPLSPNHSVPARTDHSGSGTPTLEAGCISPFFGARARVPSNQSDLQSTASLESQVQKLVTVVEDIQRSMTLIMSATIVGTAVPSEREAVPAKQRAIFKDRQFGSPELRSRNRPDIGYFGPFVADATGVQSERSDSSPIRLRL